MSIREKLKKRARSGFTMAEVIIAVAIIGVLVGIAVPSVSAIQKNLKMTELDSAARSIYVAAQNRMSELRASGELRISGGGSTLGGEGMTGEPGDYDETGLDWDADNYFYLSSKTDAAALSTLLPAGSIEAVLSEGWFYIEYNALTGMVYSVFYSDEYFDYSASDAMPRDRSSRKGSTLMLGYYGGADIDFGAAEFAPVPVLEIVNEEELYVRFTADTKYDYAVEISDGNNKVSFKVNEPTTYPSWAVPTDVVSYDAGTSKYTIMLDSLKTDMQFSALFPDLTPGADLTVTITASGEGLIPMSASGTANSLFSAVDAEKEAATVTYARHLQNLDTAFSGADIKITAAVLGGSIDWKKADAQAFVSINNSSLTSFAGNGNSISNLNAALFDSFNGSSASDKGSLSDLKLINSIVSGITGDNVGTLVNTAENVVFDKCHVYADGTAVTADSCTLTSTGAKNTGGLIGLATNCEISECSAALTRIQASTGNTGGMVGGGVGTAISKSYADTGYWNMTDESWRTNSGIITTGGTAGGLVGSASGGTITNCYAIGNIKASSGTASGFAGTSTAGAIVQNSYCATTFDESTINADRIFGFANGNYNSTTCYFLKSSVSGTAANAAGASSYDDLTKIFKSSDVWIAATAATTKAYGRTAPAGETLVLPFPRLKAITHRGDWPEEVTDSMEGLYYYEKYTNGAYGFYAEFPESEEAITVNTLRNDLDIQEDGYAILSNKYSDSISVVSDEQRTESWTVEVGSDSNISGTPVTVNGVSYNCYFLSPEKNVIKLSDNLIDVRTFYFRLTVTSGSNSDVYHFNPCFAKTAVNSDVKPSAPMSALEIRTARQLTRLSDLMNNTRYNYGWQNKSYIQTRGIDFAWYDGNYSDQLGFLPIGMSTNRFFAGSYDGGGNVITSLSIGTAGSFNNANSGIGLFGTIDTGGTVKNVFFIADGSGRTVTDRNAGNRNVGTGAFVGTNKGTIENCAVAGFTIDVTGYVAGGFAGTNSGTIRQCAAANARFTGQTSGGSITFNTTNNGPGAGGFAGVNSGIIEYCYSQASIDASGKTAGGFVCSNTGSISYSYCVTANSSSGTFVTSFGTGDTLTGCIAYNGTNITAIKLMTSSHPEWSYAGAVNTYPYDASLTGAYPFPAAVKNASSAYVHYGNWPRTTEKNNMPYLNVSYYEKYSDGSYGLYYDSETLKLNGINNKDVIEKKLTVSETGYLVLLNFSKYNGTINNANDFKAAFTVYLLSSNGSEVNINNSLTWTNKGKYWVEYGVSVVAESGNGGPFTYPITNGSKYFPIFIPSNLVENYIGVRIAGPDVTNDDGTTESGSLILYWR